MTFAPWAGNMPADKVEDAGAAMVIMSQLMMVDCGGRSSCKFWQSVIAAIC